MEKLTAGHSTHMQFMCIAYAMHITSLEASLLFSTFQTERSQVIQTTNVMVYIQTKTKNTPQYKQHVTFTLCLNNCLTTMIRQ